MKIGLKLAVHLGFWGGLISIFVLLISLSTLIHVPDHSIGFIALISLPGGITGSIIAFLLFKNHQQNHELKANELKWRTLVDLSLDGIYLEDERGKILDCNTVGHQLFGYTREEMLQLSIRDLVPTEFAHLLPDLIPPDMATGDVYLERENRKKDGTIFPTEINTKFINLNGDRRLIAYVRDISERKKTEAILKNTIETKDKLFSIIGHDLKGSLHTIVGFSDMLISNPEQFSPEEITQFLKFIRGSADQANELLMNLLSWAYIQTDKIHFSPRKLELVPPVENVFAHISELAEAKSVTLENNIASGVHVFADPEMLKTILRNLIGNAIKYSHPNSGVRVGAEQKDNNIEITVTDEGIGMSEEVLSNLFLPNKSKIQSGTNHEIGTGLGLIICKEFAEKNSGSLRAKSQLGKGTSFYLNLPAEANV
ncbi:MAG: ATP-binding protein [Mangrovibacterium sp.]